jgi:hypothetical protein
MQRTWQGVAAFLVVAAVCYGLVKSGLHVPDSVWTAVISGSVALFVLAISTGHSRKLQREQLEFNTRREVYIGAAEAISEHQITIAALPNLDIPNSEIIGKLNAGALKLARLNVVARIETLKAVTEYTCAVTEAVAELWDGRLELQARAARIQGMQRQLEGLRADKQRSAQQSGQVSTQRAVDEQILSVLNRQFEVAEHEQQRLTSEHDALNEVQGEGLLKYQEAVYKQVTALQMLLPRALVAARAEIDLEIDQADVARVFEQASIRTAAAITRAAESARALRGRLRATSGARASSQAGTAETTETGK